MKIFLDAVMAIDDSGVRIRNVKPVKVSEVDGGGAVFEEEYVLKPSALLLHSGVFVWLHYHQFVASRYRVASQHSDLSLLILYPRRFDD